MDDPLAVLRELATTRESLAALERQCVVAAREYGRSWRDIGIALGVTRQAAYSRFQAIDPRPRRAPDPMFAELEEIARRFAGGRAESNQAGGSQHPLTGPGPVNDG